MILASIRVKQAVSEYRAEIKQVLEHNRTIAIDLLTANLKRAQVKADAGDIQAVGAITGIVRELNAISMLHGSSIIIEQDQAKTYTDAEQALLKRKAIKLTDSA